MAFKSYQGQQYTGYPALVFWEMADWGKNNQTNRELLFRLEKMNSHLRAKLPLMLAYDDDREAEIKRKAPSDRTEEEKQILEVQDLLKKNGDREEGEIIKAVAELQKIGIEKTGGDSINSAEQRFTIICFGIYERIDQVVAMVDLIEKQKRRPNQLPKPDEEEDEETDSK